MKSFRFGPPAFRLLHGAVVLGVLSLGLVAACGDDEVDPDIAKQESFLKDYCAIVGPCCQSALSLPPGAEACAKRVAELDPAVVKNERARTDCLAQLRNVTQKTDFCAEFGNQDQPACPDVRRKINTGGKKPGEPCATDAECAVSFEGPVVCKTTCQLVKRGKENDGPCALTVDGDIDRPLKDPAAGATSFVCYRQDGVYCDSDAKKCLKPLGNGTECARDEQCEKTSYCDPGTNKCAQRKAGSNSCDVDSQCARTAHCEAGFCTPDTVDEGGACDKDDVCKTDYCAGGKCAKAPADARLTASCVDPVKTP